MRQRTLLPFGSSELVQPRWPFSTVAPQLEQVAAFRVKGFSVQLIASTVRCSRPWIRTSTGVHGVHLDLKEILVNLVNLVDLVHCNANLVLQH